MWTAPMTAVAGTAFTAAQWNTHGRDDFNCLAPAYATVSGGWIVTAGYGTVAQRIPTVAFVGTSGTTDSTSYTDLSSAGATLDVTTGPAVLVSIGAQVQNTNAGLGGRVGVDVSGATTMAASDLNSYLAESGNANDQFKGTWTTIFQENYTAGANTFTLKYRASGGGGAVFSNRLLAVVPF